MKNLFIILFLFFVLLYAIEIKVDIQKIEYINNKIRFKIKLKIYIFKLLIFSKNIHKKTILNLLENIKEEKRLEKQIENLEIKIEYGLKEPIKNTYIFSILNIISAVSIQNINAKKRKIELKPNYNKNYLYIKIKALIKIKHIKTFTNLIKNKKLIYKT